MKNLTVFTKTKKIVFKKDEYKASGGEGSVYVKGDIAYKIYHDSKKMIPVDKINELNSALHDIDVILSPQEIIFDLNKNPVGFTMKFVKDTEFLSRLFSTSYKQKNQISSQMMAELVVYMQQVLNKIHQRKIIVGDYNEMNFLVDSTFKLPYHIDVDSWQTPSFKGTAIMPSVMDYTVPMGNFDENTDWYSWAVVTFQIYTGLHPFRGGFHKQYRPKDWIERAKKNISIFHSDVEIPKSFSDFSHIPKKHLEWYKKVFHEKERSIPPILSSINVSAFQGIRQILESTDAFTIKLEKEYEDTIIDIYYCQGQRIVITEKEIINEQSGKKISLTRQPRKIGICATNKEDIVIAYSDTGHVHFLDFDKNEIGSIYAENLAFFNGNCYTVYNTSLTANTFDVYRKILHQTRTITNIISGAYRMFPGIMIQELFGKIRFSIPGHNSCKDIEIPELEGCRIIDAKHENGTTMILSEKGGEYQHHIFNKDKYRKEDNVELMAINFVGLSNGINLMVDKNGKVEIFNDIAVGTKIINNAPFNSETKLFNEGLAVYFFSDKKLYSVKSKRN